MSAICFACYTDKEGVCCVPANTSMLFMGDSTMRYQFLALAYALIHGRLWVKDKPDQSLVNERTFRPPGVNSTSPSAIHWGNFFNFTNTVLAPYGHCDCYRGAHSDKTYENRFVELPLNISLAFYWHGVHGDLHSHWRPGDGDERRAIVTSYGGFKFKQRWRAPDIQSALRLLVPMSRPTHVIVNVGLNQPAWFNDVFLRSFGDAIAPSKGAPQRARSDAPNATALIANGTQSGRPSEGPTASTDATRGQETTTTGLVKPTTVWKTLSGSDGSHGATHLTRFVREGASISPISPDLLMQLPLHLVYLTVSHQISLVHLFISSCVSPSFHSTNCVHRVEEGGGGAWSNEHERVGTRRTVLRPRARRNAADEFALAYELLGLGTQVCALCRTHEAHASLAHSHKPAETDPSCRLCATCRSAAAPARATASISTRTATICSTARCCSSSGLTGSTARGAGIRDAPRSSGSDSVCRIGAVGRFD